MLNEDALRRLARDRRGEREGDARAERLAFKGRRLRSRGTDEQSRVAMLGHLLAARRHATS